MENGGQRRHIAGRLRGRPLLGWGWTAAFCTLLLLLVANGWLAYSELTALIRNESLVIRSQDRLAAIDALFATLQDAETGQRGYLISAEPPYLAPYSEAVRSVDDNLRRLVEIGAERPRWEAPLGALRTLIEAKLGDLDTLIELFHEQGFNAARERLKADAGKRLMDQIREIIEQLRSQENALLGERRAASAKSRQRALLTLAVATLLSLGLLLTAFVLTRRIVQSRAERARLLETENARLERQVAERTRELDGAMQALRAENDVRQEAEQQARRFAQELQRSNRELEEFAYVASHDLQEPLRKIRAFGDRLAGRYADAIDGRGQDYIERMRQAAERMSLLITGLLTYSRVTSKGGDFQPVELDEIARQVLEDLETRIQDTGGTVELRPLPALEADPTQMRQLLQNLIGNALKYHAPDAPPAVTVSGSQDTPDSVQIRVADDGIGFDEQYLDRIFTPFQRLHNRSAYEGTGMGLAVVRRICERHGGSVSASSTPGQGATFLITLPARQREPAARPEEYSTS